MSSLFLIVSVILIAFNHQCDCVCRLETTTPSSVGLCFYCRNCVIAQGNTNYVPLAGLPVTNQLSDVQCCDACASEPNCRGFSFDKTTYQCVMYNIVDLSDQSVRQSLEHDDASQLVYGAVWKYME